MVEDRVSQMPECTISIFEREEESKVAHDVHSRLVDSCG